jgi:hypothetical protein
MNRAENRRGFALPAVILLVALLTLLLTSGLTRVRTDRQIAHASEETAGALTLAEGGLETYLGTTTTAPADGDSARINLVGGYANVTAHLVRRPADSLLRRLYVIRATGVAINPLEGATPQAVRTVARFAEWQIGYIARRAALTAANGLRQRPGAPSYLRIYGQDGACGTEPTIPGARTTTFITDSGPPLPDFQGAPPLREQGAGAGATIASQTEIDWAATIGGGIVPDYTTFHNGDASYPVQLKSGDLVLAG